MERNAQTAATLNGSARSANHDGIQNEGQGKKSSTTLDCIRVD